MKANWVSGQWLLIKELKFEGSFHLAGLAQLVLLTHGGVFVHRAWRLNHKSAIVCRSLRPWRHVNTLRFFDF